MSDSTKATSFSLLSPPAEAGLSDFGDLAMRLLVFGRDDVFFASAERSAVCRTPSSTHVKICSVVKASIPKS